MSTYVFDQAWRAEATRLGSLQALLDPATCRHLAARGVGPGWRCLEVGAGAGSIACWLADRVGPSGHVVATDLDTRFLEPHARPNLDVRRHDIAHDPLEADAYDLVHARALLEHLPARDLVLTRLIGALRPGGWLVIEDIDFEPSMARPYFVPSTFAATGERVYRAVERAMQAAGGDTHYGAKLPRLFMAAGLDDVAAETHVQVVAGGQEQAWVRLTVEQLRPRLVGGGLIGEADADAFLRLLGQPAARYIPPFMVTAWGRRPRRP